MQIEQFSNNPERQTPQTEAEPAQTAEVLAAQADAQTTDIESVSIQLQEAGSNIGAQATELGRAVVNEAQMVQLAETIKAPTKETVIYTTGIEGQKMVYTDLENYEPITTPDSIPIPSELRAFILEPRGVEQLWISKVVVGNVMSQNLENSDADETKDWLLNHLDSNPELLQELEIKDIYNVSPQQAIMLVKRIVVAELKYDKAQTKHDKRKAHDNDTDSISELLDEGDGICRNYTAAVSGLFQALKDVQSPESSQLRNTYSVRTSNNDNNGEIRLSSGVMVNHVWNTFYTISPNNEVSIASVDATIEDTVNQEHGTEEHLLMEIEDLVAAGLVAPNFAPKFLSAWLNKPENANSPAYYKVLMNAETYSYEIGELAANQIDSLSNTRHKLEAEILQTIDSGVNPKELSAKDSEIYVMHLYDTLAPQEFIKTINDQKVGIGPNSGFILLAAKLEAGLPVDQALYDFTFNTDKVSSFQPKFLSAKYPIAFKAIKNAYR